ncbi:MAG TPA: outer membrane beta-barrel protein [Methylocystis sp.]|jgi:outer membrane immunogenic protein
MFKKSLVTVAAICAPLAGSALAADLPSHKGPPPAFVPPPPAPAWTGFYVGLNAGYTFSDSNSVRIASSPLLPSAGVVAWAAGANAIAPVQTDGFIGGGQIGYNVQFANSFVAGLEADIQGVASDGGSSVAATALPFRTNTFFTTLTTRKTLDYLGTVRGRLGFLVTPSLLIYGTGGLAYGGVQTSASVFQFSALNGVFGSGAGSFSDTRVGWAAGGGAEWLFLPNWSAKIEYLYYDLGSVVSQFALAGPPAPIPFAVSQSTSRFNGHLVRAGLNYHFNLGPDLVVAKY